MLREPLLILLTLFAMYDIVECGCFWQGQTYDIGQTWNLPDFPCVNCTCQINDDGVPAVGCKNKPCPKPRCRRPKIDPNVCCPYCEVADEEDYSENEQRAGCDTPSRHYKHGDVYSSNSTGIRPTSDNQCVMCICQNGQQLCHLKTCIMPKTCSKFINSSDDCCPQCADCVDVSGIKRNGTKWHPTIASIGQIDCITCSCINGRIKCKNRRNKRKGKPCGGKRKERNKHRHNKKYCRDKKNKKKKRCSKKRRKAMPPTLPTTIPPGVELKNLCIKKNTKYLVYKAILDKEMFIAFDDLEEDTVEVFRWIISQGTGRSVVTYTEPEILPAPEFRRQINNTNVVGTTGTKHYKRFKRRLKGKLEKCKDSCQPELFIKILQRVKVRLLKFGEECKT